LIGLLYTNLRALTVLQTAGAVLWTAGAARAVFSHTLEKVSEGGTCSYEQVIELEMSKRRKLEVADTTQWSTAAAVPLNWDLCILCQTRTCEPLICPTVAGYTSLINKLSRFAEFNALPWSINLEQIDDGSGVLTTFDYERCQISQSLSK